MFEALREGGEDVELLDGWVSALEEGDRVGGGDGYLH